MLGVSSVCAEAHFPSSQNVRLVATTTDSTGSHRNEISAGLGSHFRLRVLLIRDQKTHQLVRLSYSITSLGGGGGGENHIYFEPDTTIQRTTESSSGKFLYVINLKTRSDATKDISIELETSATPFPQSSPTP